MFDSIKVKTNNKSFLALRYSSFLSPILILYFFYIDYLWKRKLEHLRTPGIKLRTSYLRSSLNLGGVSLMRSRLWEKLLSHPHCAGRLFLSVHAPDSWAGQREQRDGSDQDAIGQGMALIHLGCLFATISPCNWQGFACLAGKLSGLSDFYSLQIYSDLGSGLWNFLRMFLTSLFLFLIPFLKLEET